jgi:uncharacterized protein (DUF1778 family)
MHSDGDDHDTGAEALRDRGSDQCESARAAAQQDLLDQRLFLVSGSRYRAFQDLLAGPARDNPGLRDLFSRPEP